MTASLIKPSSSLPARTSTGTIATTASGAAIAKTSTTWHTFVSIAGVITGTKLKSADSTIGAGSIEILPINANDSRIRESNSGRIYYDGYNHVFRSETNTQFARIDQIGNLLFGSTTFSEDVGVKRNAANVLEINNGTAGTFADLKLRNYFTPDTQTLTGAGAVTLTNYSTLIVTTGANALTLAAGAEGQHKFIRHKTDGGDGTLTVTNLQGGTTITFNDAGDFVQLYYIDSRWHIIVNSGCAVA